MILTLTPNPSVDATLSLDHALERGQVQRLTGSESVAGGKGVNVSQAVVLAGMDSIAVFPTGKADRYLDLVGALGIPFESVEVDGAVRVNTAITEPDGTTTKLNGQGAFLDEDALARIEDVVVEKAADASWAVLAGSLPPGAPTDWYAHLVAKLRSVYPQLRIAVDTSDAPLIELGAHFSQAAPSLIKPNGLELGQLAGVDGQALEDEAEQGNFGPVIEVARKVITMGVEQILVTLGAAGAVLVTADQAFKATPPPTKAVSTVGAGDSSLAGFIMAQELGQSVADSLRQAVAYGSAAASLPGTTIPSPAQINVAQTNVVEVN
ncbi:1-phosphofructokinase family hexose kinase [Corynebacterium sp. SCR221107]|uniref:1-phosphofructokinase family hexose kinase n=1 Tax=Corynebacterium sp. SCR221107 TaxID=3017361 RepID=UPI0022EC5476|nr:1-phosphofructokinase family hexose kinase [Corynebacterium sp. SCR221107]WBT07856.1 1-phosphofructokinase family hexose kinase [Corynebacterium sp. SCR221107]